MLFNLVSDNQGCTDTAGVWWWALSFLLADFRLSDFIIHCGSAGICTRLSVSDTGIAL